MDLVIDIDCPATGESFQLTLCRFGSSAAAHRIALALFHVLSRLLDRIRRRSADWFVEELRLQSLDGSDVAWRRFPLGVRGQETFAPLFFLWFHGLLSPQDAGLCEKSCSDFSGLQAHLDLLSRESIPFSPAYPARMGPWRDQRD